MIYNYCLINRLENYLEFRRAAFNIKILLEGIARRASKAAKWRLLHLCSLRTNKK